MTIQNYRHPVLFYGLSLLIPWALWFTAAYISHLETISDLHVLVASILGFIGLSSPMIVAFILIFSNSDLRNDFWKRLFNVKATKPIYIFLTFFLMLLSILLAQLISLLFGYSASQFALSGNFSFTAGIFPAWFLLFIAPLLEELAWHTYGTDCLRKRFNLFTVSVGFAIFWGFWHFPLSFIKDYYQSNVAETGVIYSINFVVSLIPFVLLMNWLYYKTGRNILVAVIFHITSGFFNEIFATHPMSKVIQTVLLLILAIIIVIKDRDYFFKLEYRETCA